MADALWRGVDSNLSVALGSAPFSSNIRAIYSREEVHYTQEIESLTSPSQETHIFRSRPLCLKKADSRCMKFHLKFHEVMASSNGTIHNLAAFTLIYDYYELQLLL